MELVTGAIGSLLPKLGELLKEEYNLQKGVREKIKTLTRELQSVGAVLRKVGEVPWDQLDELAKLWVMDVREASYDMEDTIDTFLVCMDGPEPTEPQMLRRLRKKMGNLFKKSKARRKISNLIQDINKKLEEVAARRARYSIDSIVANPVAPKSIIDPRVRNLYKRATELVGIDGPRNQLIRVLSIGDDVDVVSEMNMKIVSIVGFGGMGKTTLAKVVYDQLKPHFKCRAFVSVGQNPDMKRVFRDILIDLDNGWYMNPNLMMLDEKKLIEKLKEFVQEKRCLIVIDDIWEMESWKLMRCALEYSDCGSRVVITTRISEIATHAGEPYQIKPLSHEESKTLLFARILGDDRKFLDDPSVEACNKILRKCAGVPLAIITIASLLASKPGEDWSDIYNSIGFGHEGNDDVKNTRMILSFSYYDLSSHLKACLLYLSIFPEDHEIKKNGLIWRWIAEGFINEEQAAGVGLFELGERYFNELINRSMIQPVDSEGYVHSCRVHDMVLDLVRSLSSQENFVTVLDGSEKQKFQGSIARRLALQRTEGDISGQLAKIGVEKVRTLIANKCDINWLPPRIPFLRVLDVKGCYVEKDYDIIGSSLHLRYLKLGKGWIDVLPKKVGNLKFLQTLDLSEFYVGELPEEIGLLTQLVSLRARVTRIVPGQISKLTSLQELDINVRFCGEEFVKELGLLRALRVLHASIEVKDESMKRTLLESLGNLHNIQHLYIGGSSADKGVTWDAGFASYQHLRYLKLSVFVFSGVLEWIKPSLAPDLSYLHLNVTSMKEQDMETLGRMPELCFLELELFCTNLVSIKIPTYGVGYFRKLRILRILGSFIWFDPHTCECNSRSSIEPTVIMPSLESLQFTVYVRFLKDATTMLCFDKLLTGFENLGRNCLSRVIADINCHGARRSEVEKSAAALVRATAVHPTRPTLETRGTDVEFMFPPYLEACVDAKRSRTPELVINKSWKLASITCSGYIGTQRMPDPADTSSKIVRLLYANNGMGLSALSSNAVHKVWIWKASVGNSHGKSTTSDPPEFWQPRNNILMTNDTTCGNNPEEAAACSVLSKHDCYMISASGGKVSLFNMMAFQLLATFVPPPPAATSVALFPQDNNFTAIGMEDSSILIYNVRFDSVIHKLMGHDKKVTGLAFSQSMDLLVSTGADAQICIWCLEIFEKKKSTYLQPPSNHSGDLVGDTMVQFCYNETHLLVVHESQLAVYDGDLKRLHSWIPGDTLAAPISSAVYSSDGLLIYAGFCDGTIGIFEAESLSLQCRIASSAYIPASISSGGESVYPMVVAAHPFKPYQFAVGMSDGAVHVLEPLDTDAEAARSSDSSGQVGWQYYA